MWIEIFMIFCVDFLNAFNSNLSFVLFSKLASKDDNFSFYFDGEIYSLFYFNMSVMSDTLIVLN